MVKVYIALLYANKRTWAQIPEKIKEDVKNALMSDVENEVISSEYFEEITGEVYSQ